MQFNGKSTLMLYPFILHSLSMSIFSSVIGPFGGFFASGFKRAFKIKVIQYFLINLYNIVLEQLLRITWFYRTSVI